MEKQAFDIKQVEFTQLGGQSIEVKDIDKLLGNVIYMGMQSLGFLIIAQQIYQGEVVELSKQERDTLVLFLQSDEVPILAFARKPIIDHLNNLKF